MVTVILDTFHGPDEVDRYIDADKIKLVGPAVAQYVEYHASAITDGALKDKFLVRGRKTAEIQVNKANHHYNVNGEVDCRSFEYLDADGNGVNLDA